MPPPLRRRVGIPEEPGLGIPNFRPVDNGESPPYVIDLTRKVVSVPETKYVTRIKEEPINQVVSRVLRVVTALKVNYVANGKLYTSVVIPTRIVIASQIITVGARPKAMKGRVVIPQPIPLPKERKVIL